MDRRAGINVAPAGAALIDGWPSLSAASVRVRGVADDQRRPFWLVVSIVAGLAFAAAALAIPARATYGAQTTADEPQYLLSAISLADDGDLDISNQLDDRAYQPFHEARLNEQTIPLDASGRRVSPHDPLLPVVLAPAVAVGGWVAAKLVVAVFAAATAAITVWVAVRRLRVSLPTAAVVVGAAFVGVPLASYGSQIYPEMPAALCVVAAVGTLLAPRFAWRHTALVGAATVALPWLSVKYAPVVAVLAVLALFRMWVGRSTGQLVVFVVWGVLSAVVYLWLHRVVYGGWTVYAAGDHFVEAGEFAVVGGNPNYVGRSQRWFGLLSDRRYGLIGWSPIWMLLPASVVWLAGSSDRSRFARGVVLAPFVVGWSTATFVALSMHSWWTPGRQIVVVAPLAVLAMCTLVDRFGWLRPVALTSGVVAATNWLWVVVESSTGRRTVVVDFFDTAAPFYRLLAPIFAQGWPRTDAADLVRTIWVGVFGLSMVLVTWLARRGASRRRWAVGLVVGLVVVGTLGWFGGDDGELTRPAVERGFDAP